MAAMEASMPASQRARVTESHVSSPQSPVKFTVGDILGVGHRDRQWTTYVWVTDQGGHAGWVPDTYLEMTGEHEAVAIRDYDATELTIVKDEIVEVISRHIAVNVEDVQVSFSQDTRESRLMADIPLLVRPTRIKR